MKPLRVSQLCVISVLILVLCVAWSAAGPKQMTGKQLDSHHGAGSCGQTCVVLQDCDIGCNASDRGACDDAEPSDCCSFRSGNAGDGCEGGEGFCPKTACSDC